MIGNDDKVQEECIANHRTMTKVVGMRNVLKTNELSGRREATRDVERVVERSDRQKKMLCNIFYA